jgi:Raf kinase inhibitor-like YbhB/YbcL family protein
MRVIRKSPRRGGAVVLAALAALVATGCGGAAKPTTTSSPASAPPTAAPPAGSRGSIVLTSGFVPGARIPPVYTCHGKDVSPPLRASDLPAATKEVVVIMRDPDAPGGNFIHWAIAHLEPARQSLGLPTGVKPLGAVVGRNSFGSLGYRGPCPPAGPAHHYEITVYALGQPSGLKRGFSAGEVTGLPILAQATLTGTYGRH